MSKKGSKKRGENAVKPRNKPPVGKRFTSEYQPAENGRPKKLENVIKSIPKDAQIKIHEVLFSAIRQPSRAKAIALLEAKGEELGEYGFILQIAIKSLSGHNGMTALESILDRLFGKPKQQNEIGFMSGDGEISKITVEVRNFSKEGECNDKTMDEKDSKAQSNGKDGQA